MKTTATTVTTATTSLEVQQATTALNIENIKGDIAEIKQSLRDLGGLYVTTREFNDTVDALKLEQARLSRRGALWAWLGPSLSAGVASIVTFLVIEYLQHLK